MDTKSYMTPLQNLGTEGLKLVDLVKQKGKQVREFNSEFVSQSRKLLLQKQQLLNTIANKQQFRVAQVISKIKNLSDPKELEDATSEYIAQLEKLKQIIADNRKEIEKFKTNPPGNEKREKLISEFNKLLNELVAIGKQMNVKIPYQLEYCAIADPDSTENQIVDFEGGKITDKDGNNIWGCECYTCGLEIQDGATGEGLDRYHCLDHANVDQCVECFTNTHILVDTLKKHNAFKALKLLETKIKYLDSLFVKENNHFVFLRLRISNSQCIASWIYNALTTYSNRPCLGVMNNNNEYKWISYEEVRKKSIILACAMKNKLGLNRGSFVGICSSNRTEWILTDISCTFNDFISIGLHTSWPQNDLEYVINNADISCVVCDADNFSKFVLASKNCKTLKHIIVMDDPTSTSIEHTNINVEFMNDLLKIDCSNQETYCGLGLQTELGFEIPPEKRGDNTTFSLIYSSGTTGTPKGIITTKQTWFSENLADSPFKLMNPLVITSYAALAHGMDRGMVWQTIGEGGRVGFAQESNIFEYTKILGPVVFIAMPHIWNGLYSQYIKALENALKGQPKTKEKEITQQILAEFSSVLGPRVKQIATGGASISPSVFQFLKDCFSQCTIVDAYGTTEAPGISTNGRIRSTVKVKLIDVPELGYSIKDKPFPRGEICVKTPTQTPGYYKQPEKTKQLFDTEGFIRTGDIGMIDDNGLLHIIDRKGNFIEMYVNGRSVWAPCGELESKFKNSEKIDQIYIHGERTEDALVAVIVPNCDYVKSFIEKNKIKLDDIKNDNSIKQELLLELKNIGRKFKLVEEFIPKIVIIEINPWTIDNGLITNNGKIIRSKLDQKYKLAIALEYDKHNKSKV